MAPNVELLTQTLRYIEDHPEEWDQDKWLCDTVACFAGHACLLSGFTRSRAYTLRHPSVDKNFSIFEIQNLAQSLLGLESSEASHLFSASNSMDDLRRIVKDIVERNGGMP